ncbi:MULTISPECIES: hypothetical protein [Neorhizobium]|uniref:hypothetical protein n=1 Tax=Neorhizobium TaxID=1525371 RepID=UPI00344F6EEF
MDFFDLVARAADVFARNAILIGIRPTIAVTPDFHGFFAAVDFLAGLCFGNRGSETSYKQDRNSESLHTYPRRNGRFATSLKQATT